MRRFSETVDTDGVNVKRNMGARKWRRVENGITVFFAQCVGPTGCPQPMSVVHIP